MKVSKLVVILFCLFLLAAQGIQAQDDEPVPMGTPVTTDDWEITATGTREETILSGQNLSTIYANQGFVFFIVEITFVNLNHPSEETSISSSFPMTLTIDGESSPSIGIGSSGSNYCVSTGTEFCVSTTSTESDTLSLDFVFLLTEADANADEMLLQIEDAQPILITTAFIPPAPFTVPSAAITSSNIEAITQIAVLLNYHDSFVFLPVFSPDSRLLATSSLDTGVRLFDLEANTDLAIFESAFWVSFSPDSSLVAIVGDGLIQLWDIEANEEVAMIEDASGAIFSPDGTLLALGGSDGSVWLWNVEAGEEQAEFDGHEEAAILGAFSADGRFLTSSSCLERDENSLCIDSEVKLWDVEAGDEAAVFDDTMSAVFNPDGTLLALVSNDKSTVTLWDIEANDAGPQNSSIALVNDVAFSPDGTLLAVGGCPEASDSGGCITAGFNRWDFGARSELVFSDQGGIVFDVNFSPDGTVLAVGGWNGDYTINLWNAESFDMMAALEGQVAVGFSPNSVLMATGSEQGTVTLWGIPDDE